MKQTKKQFNLTSLLPAIAAFVMIGIFAGIGAKVLADFDDDLTDATTADDAVKNATEGIGNLSENLGLLGTIVILGVIIAVLVGVLGFFRFRG